MNDNKHSQPTQSVSAANKTLKVTIPKDKSQEEVYAALACDPAFRSLSTTEACGSAAGDVDFAANLQVLRGEIAAVNRGDLRSVESTLTVQSNTLDALFNELAKRAMMLGHSLSASERYLCLALKTQNQCRATLQVLANIKRPATVIAQQANVSTGMQQVNNHAAAPQPSS